MPSRAKVRMGKNSLHKRGYNIKKGSPSYGKKGGRQGTAKSVGQDVKRLKPLSRKLPKGKGVGRDVYLQKRFDKQRRKMYGLSNQEDGGMI